MNLRNPWRHPAVNCPKCGKKIDAVQSATKDYEAPRPGDFSICVYCLEFLVFAKVKGKLTLESIKLEDIKSQDSRRILTEFRDYILEKKGFCA